MTHISNVAAAAHDIRCSLLRLPQGASRSFQYRKGMHLSIKRRNNPRLTIKAHDQTYDSQITILADMPLFESPHVRTPTLSVYIKQLTNLFT